MKLENQLTSLELSKKLKELGAKQESLFYWVENEFDNPDGGYSLHYQPSYRRDYSAFTVAELGEMLPSMYTPTRFVDESDRYGWEWRNEDFYMHQHTEANARAKVLIYLLENKLIKL